MKWKIKNIVLCSFFISLWSLISTTLFIFRPFFQTTGFIPIFYILIWIQAFYFPPREAFLTGFIGHALFDMQMIFDFFFIFIWFASGISCFLISVLRKKKLSWIMILLMPIIYIILFLIMGTLKFYQDKDGILSFINYLKANPIIIFMIIFVNPLFNFFVYMFFIKSKIIKKLFEVLHNKKLEIK